ncbi:hypothetical protein Tco_1524381 [Tanacetum coccineum]
MESNRLMSNKVKSGVHYPAFDPDIPWDKMQPTLGMRYETQQQLKLELANYGVGNGYQLWVMPNKVRSGVKKKVVKKQIVKKKVVKKQTVKKTTVLDSGEGTRINVAVNDWLPEAVHRKCSRLIYANFQKEKYCGLHIKRLFWAAASCTLEQQFVQIMDQIKQLHEGAYDYLIQRNPNSWSRAFFEMDRRSGCCTSCKLAALEYRRMDCTVPSGLPRSWKLGEEFKVVMVVNLQHKVVNAECRELSVMNLFKAYIFQVKPVFGSNMWKRTSDVPPLPPLVRTMPGRPQKARIKAPGETCSSHTSRVGRTMTCTNCWQKGHNKASCRGRGGSVNEASGSGMGGIDEANGSGMETSGGGTRDGGTSSRGGGGRGSRGVGSTRGGGMAGSSSMGILTAEEEYQVERDEEAFRECMQEQAREQAKIDVEQEREDSMEEAHFNTKYAEVLIPSIHNLPTQQSGVAEESIVDKGKGKESPADEALVEQKEIREGHQVMWMHGTGSTPEKAFDVDD